MLLINNFKLLMQFSHLAFFHKCSTKLFAALGTWNIPFGLKWLLAKRSTETSQYVYQIGWRFNFNSGETVTNIDNTEKNKVSLNPLVTLKQPKQVSAQTRWGEKKKRKEGPPLLVHVEGKPTKRHRRQVICVRFSGTVEVSLPMDYTNIITLYII